MGNGAFCTDKFYRPAMACGDKPFFFKAFWGDFSRKMRERADIHLKRLVGVRLIFYPAPLWEA